jgi:hypothetical protein
VESLGGEVTWTGVDARGYGALCMYTHEGESNVAVGDYVVFETDRKRWHSVGADDFNHEYEL